MTICSAINIVTRPRGPVSHIPRQDVDRTGRPQVDGKKLGQEIRRYYFLDGGVSDGQDASDGNGEAGRRRERLEGGRERGREESEW